MIILERYEEGMAVIEVDGNMRTIQKNLVDKNAKEGDVLKYIGGKYLRDNDATAKKREAARKKYLDMWQD